jgi:hypothetical protein
MAKLGFMAVAFGILALATAAPSRAETLREMMKRDPSIHLYTVEFRSNADHHRHVTGIKVIKVIDGTNGHNVTRSVHVSPRFVSAARARIQHDLELPHIRHQAPPPYYNSFMYSPSYPDVIIIDPDRPIDRQQP